MLGIRNPFLLSFAHFNLQVTHESWLEDGLAQNTSVSWEVNYSEMRMNYRKPFLTAVWAIPHSPSRDSKPHLSHVIYSKRDSDKWILTVSLDLLEWKLSERWTVDCTTQCCWENNEFIVHNIVSRAGACSEWLRLIVRQVGDRTRPVMVSFLSFVKT